MGFCLSVCSFVLPISFAVLSIGTTSSEINMPNFEFHCSKSKHTGKVCKGWRDRETSGPLGNALEKYEQTKRIYSSLPVFTRTDSLGQQTSLKWNAREFCERTKIIAVPEESPLDPLCIIMVINIISLSKNSALLEDRWLDWMTLDHFSPRKFSMSS